MSGNGISYDLIITIVPKGSAEEVIEAAREAGAEGGTILMGRGTGIHEKAKILGIAIEPEKEIVLTLIDRRKTRQILDAVAAAVDLDKPGKGIAAVLKVEEVLGISHLADFLEKRSE